MVTRLSTAVLKQPILSRLNKQQTYMRAPSLSVWEEGFFFFADFEQLHKHTCMCQNPRLCKYHSDLGLKKE